MFEIQSDTEVNVGQRITEVKTWAHRIPHRRALHSHLYLYINIMEWHAGRLQRRHLMPCQNITPVTVLPKFDRLPCQGMEHFMSPICRLTDGWVRRSGLRMDAWRHTHSHTRWPVYRLFVRSHNPTQLRAMHHFLCCHFCACLHLMFVMKRWVQSWCLTN